MILNQYEWDPELDKIGQGAFAEVFKARDHYGSYAALKIYSEAIVKSTTGGSSSVQSKYSLQQEFEKGKDLSHTNIIRYTGLDFINSKDAMGRESAYPVLFMEYADSGNLESRINSNVPPDREESLAIIREILEGLGYLHRQGIIHRDLKPGNILFKKDRTGHKVAKITDFGISKDLVTDHNSQPGFATTIGVGTTLYMAPEQFLKNAYGLNGSISNRTDLWAAGVILYRLLTHTMPFGSKGMDYEALMEEITTKDPDYQLVPLLYQPIIRGLLQKKAANRFADAATVLKVLDGGTAPVNEPASNAKDWGDATVINREIPKAKVQGQTGPNPPPPPPPPPYVSKTSKPAWWATTAKILGYIAAALFVIRILSTVIAGINAAKNNSYNNYNPPVTVVDTTPVYVADSVFNKGTSTEFTYTGYMVNGKFQGEGNVVYPNNDTYKGHFSNGYFNGYGLFSFHEGGSYKGDWVNGYKQGKGIYKWASGESYDGHWVEGKMEGTGWDKLPNGDSYEGEFKNGKRNGSGTYYHANGLAEDGKWIDDKLNGMVSRYQDLKFKDSVLFSNGQEIVQ